MVEELCSDSGLEPIWGSMDPDRMDTISGLPTIDTDFSSMVGDFDISSISQEDFGEMFDGAEGLFEGMREVISEIGDFFSDFL